MYTQRTNNLWLNLLTMGGSIKVNLLLKPKDKAAAAAAYRATIEQSSPEERAVILVDVHQNEGKFIGQVSSTDALYCRTAVIIHPQHNIFSHRRRNLRTCFSSYLRLQCCRCVLLTGRSTASRGIMLGHCNCCHLSTKCRRFGYRWNIQIVTSNTNVKLIRNKNWGHNCTQWCTLRWLRWQLVGTFVNFGHWTWHSCCCDRCWYAAFFHHHTRLSHSHAARPSTRSWGHTWSARRIHW